ncbi:hypothetical protein IWQ61_001014 [Dispira simplex]|nr:hypothetical protein IWQ61_001014 [Dispira simplex]
MPKSAFKRVVEQGRVVLLNHGPHAGKLAVIVAIIDHNRALIDGPTTGVPRQSYSYRRMTLTDLKVSQFPCTARSGYLKKLIEEQEIEKKWNASAWAKKLDQRAKRAALNDFERFQVVGLRMKRRDAVRAQYVALKKAQTA